MSGQEPTRSQSTTSLSRFYNSSAANGGRPAGAEDTNDPRLDFCNSFWGVDNRGYDVVMARLRGAGRTIDELKAFWKERAAIEEDYSKRLTKLSKTTLGKDEIGDLAISLQHVLEETLQQAQYHHSLSNELKTNVEQPTARLAERMTALRRGIQAQVERSWRNKGLQEGHVSKAREKYEQDCLKLNSYHANQALTQGKEAEKLQSKVERVRQTIGQNEQDFRQFVRVLEGTQAKWEQEWKVFCDAVQDEEEERLAATKDIIWSYANAVSQVCVEDDSSCERVREKLEQFEPQNDMVAFVRGWGTGDQIPDPPQFVNYSAGEYPKGRTSHIASFTRETNRPLPPPVENYLESEGVQGRDGASSSMGNRNGPNGNVNGNGSGDDLASGMQSVNLQGDQIASSPIPAPPPADEKPRAPFGGIAMPGLTDPRAPSPGPQSLASPALANDSLPKRLSSMGPPPAPPTMSMPEPRIPSRQGPPSPAPRSAQLDEDPMAKALADLRRDAPPASSVRRNASHIRRPDSTSGYSNRGMNNTSPAPASSTGHGAAGAPGSGRMSYQQPPSQPSAAELTLSPPAPGHTAAALAKSMDDFNRRTDKRGSVSYNTYGDDVVGAHPSSRPASPSPSNAPRAPSPAMMQPPSQPATHIADEVLSQYHQAFPGERNDRARSRAGSVTSHRSGNSFVPPSATQGQGQGPGEDPAARQAFAGIGAGGRSPSPAPQQPSFASPSISPVVSHGNLGPQNLGIRLDASGSITQDSMAEAYRRQYQAQQQQTQGGVAGGLGDGQGQQRGSFYAGQGQGQGHGQMPGQQPPKSPMAMSGPPPIGQRPTSAYGGPTQPHQQQPQGGPGPQQYTSPTSYAPPNTFATSPSMQQQQPPQQQQFGQQHRSQHSYSSQSQGYSNTAAPPAGYMGHQGPPQAQQQQQQQQQPQGYGGWAQQQHQPQQPQQQQNGYANRSASPAPPMQQHAQQQNPYQRSVSAAPGRGPSPAPMAQNQLLYRGASPAPGQQQQQQQYRAPSPAAQPQMGGYYPGSAQGHGQGQGQQTYSGYQGQPAQQQQSQQQQQRMARTPSPQPGVAPANAAPTGQWSTTGLPVLFYVKALYDYQSTSAAEFDFQAGDIIAVTSTPDDGWWSGELLDEARRIPGRTDFPSNL